MRAAAIACSFLKEFAKNLNKLNYQDISSGIAQSFAVVSLVTLKIIDIVRECILPLEW